jgi:hypothetical protein
MAGPRPPLNPRILKNDVEDNYLVGWLTRKLFGSTYYVGKVLRHELFLDKDAPTNVTFSSYLSPGICFQTGRCKKPTRNEPSDVASD